jgi:protocatechuate 3,4-dioxygenase beta subunit
MANDGADFHASISGSVIDAVSGEPLRKAYVRLTPAPATGKIRPTVTDAKGRFLFEDVRPGSYSLEAEHQGFLDSSYGDEAGVPLELTVGADQDLSGLEIKLMPPAAISGRVINEDGDLWTHAVVSVFRSKWEHGKRHLEGFSSADTDDKGEFYAGHLPPGRYYLLAEPDAYWEARNRATIEPRLQPTWYPSSLDSSTAAPVVLLPGQELTGSEIRLRRSSVYRISGKVSGMEQLPALPGLGHWMRPRLSVSPAPGVGGNSKSGSLNNNGSFEIEGVAPGTYQIRVEEGMLPARALASLMVQVQDHDVVDVSLKVHPPHPLRGVIRMEGDDATLPPGMLLWLDSSEGLVWEETTAPRKDGNFEFANVPLGLYRIHVRSGSSGRYYLKTVHYGGIETSDAAFSFSGAPDPIELTISARGASVRGTIKRKDSIRKDAAGSAKVVLLPYRADAESKFSEAQLGVLDQSGAFTMKNAVRPGDYTLYAFEGVPDGAWTVAEFIKEIDGKGVRVKVREGDVKTVEVPLIPRSDIAALLIRLGMN